MGTTRDFFTASIGDSIMPALRRPMEDIIYETLDDRQVPTRTDFLELRDNVNALRSGNSSAKSAVERLTAKLDELEERINQLESGPKRSAASKPAASAPGAKSCKVAGCNGKLRAKGYCAKHYQKMRRGTL